MSMQQDLGQFLSSMAEGTIGKDVKMTPEQMALQTGIARDKVNKTLNNLSTRKRLELLRGENGRSIIGYRLLEPPTDRRRKASSNGHVPVAAPKRRGRPPKVKVEEPAPVRRRRFVITPMTDAYAESKARYNRFVETMGDRVEAHFKEDPLAEEAMALKERLDMVEEQLAEATRHNAELDRDNRALRTRHMQAVERKVMESGAAVVHGD